MMAQPPAQVTSTIAPGANRQGFVFAAGLTLILLNFALSPEGTTIIVALLNSPATTIDPRQYVLTGDVTVVDLGLQGVGLILLTVLAGVSDDAGSLAMLFVVALWLGFALHTYTAYQAKQAKK